MTWLQGLVLGIVQGLPEFLPVSSSGRPVVTQAAFGLVMPGVLLGCLAGLAALLAFIGILINTTRSASGESSCGTNVRPKAAFTRGILAYRPDCRLLGFRQAQFSDYRADR